MTQKKFDLLLKRWIKETKDKNFKEKINNNFFKELYDGKNDSVKFLIDYFKEGKIKNVPFGNIAPLFGLLTKITGAHPIKPQSFANYNLCVKDWIDYYENKYGKK